MTLCRSRGEPGRVRHRGEQVQCGVWCSARRLPSSQGLAPETAVCRPVLSQVEGPLQATGPLPRSGGLTSRSLARVNNPGWCTIGRKMSAKTTIAIVCLQLIVIGCAAQRPVLYPNAQLKRVGTSAAEGHVDECMRRADEYVRSGGESDKALEGAGIAAGTGAAVGAAGGAAGGAVVGRAGTWAGIGAASGAAAGATRVAIHEMFRRRGPSPVYRNFVNRCLRDKGYDPIGWQ